MIRTLYAIQIAIYEVTADLAEHGQSIDPSTVTRADIGSFYAGSLGTKRMPTPVWMRWRNW